MPLPHHPVSLEQYVRRNAQPQSVGSLEIDDKFDFRIHLYRNLRWLSAFENLVYQPGRLLARGVKVWTVAGQTAALHNTPSQVFDPQAKTDYDYFRHVPSHIPMQSGVQAGLFSQDPDAE
jgi:hypothetical protein